MAFLMLDLLENVSDHCRTFIGVNLVVDVLYGVVNPRIRGGGN